MVSIDATTLHVCLLLGIIFTHEEAEATGVGIEIMPFLLHLLHQTTMEQHGLKERDSILKRLEH